MPFTRFACWENEGLHQVIRPDAEAINDVLFSAVHTHKEIILSRSEGEPSDIMPDGFLAEFTNPNKEHVQAAIVGRSGAGKSHLIQWLRLQLPSDDENRVITIPKAGMSLRNILRLIIDELPEELRGDYIMRLDQAEDDDLSVRIKRIRLLHSLVQALEQEKIDSDLSQLSDTEADLLDLLPKLFGDTDLQENWFLKDGNIIDRLVRHIYREDNSRDRDEDLREFTVADLPGDRAITSGVARTTQQLIVVLNMPGYSEAAISIINKCFQRAVGLTLSFGGDSLIELLKDVRRHLKSEGKKLTLLIEDLVRLQGIDHALLQALIIDARQGEGDLCQLRWAAAVTTGYYETLPATVRTRMDYIVTIDAENVEGSRGGQGQVLTEFTAKYLNAARLGLNKLEEWYQAGEASTVPNMCETCPHADECHEAFGAVEGVGLYPFNREALVEMNERTADNDEWFNPRRLLKKVLLAVLDNNRDDIVEGLFPSAQFLESFGGAIKMPPIEQARVRNQSAESGRYLALLELWDCTGSFVRMPDSMVHAFGLTQVGEDIPEGEMHGALPEEPTQDTAPPEPELDRTISSLRNWASGEPLSDRMVNDLRRLVFSAIEDFINWDEIEIGKSFFMGQSGKPFKSTSVNFLNQSMRIPSTEVALTIPFDSSPEGLTQAAVALEGLYLNTQHHSWDFDRGPFYLATILECLREWSESVIEQAISLQPQKEGWDVFQGAVELMTIGAMLSGKVKSSDADGRSTINEIFRKDYSPGSGLRSPELKGLANKIASKWEMLTAYVRSCVSGSKGTREGAFIFPEDIKRIARELRLNKWRMLQQPDEEGKNKKFNEIGRLYQRVASELPDAINQELKHHRDWVLLVENSFGPGCSKSEIVESFKGVRDAFLDAGVPMKRANAFDSALTEFSACQFDNALKLTRPFVDKTGDENFHRFGREGLRSPMSLAEALIDNASLVFEAAESELTGRERDFAHSGGETLRQCQSEIADSLEQLSIFFESFDSSRGE